MSVAGSRTLDHEALAQLEGIGGNELVTEMIELFLQNAPRRLKAAREACDGGDLAAMHRAVHSLKSTAGNLGARRLQAAAGAAEARANEKALDAIPPLLDDLGREYRAVRDELEAERDRRQGARGRTEEPK